ncbi:MAG: phytanoyl-CoA dioxygenase family protein [Leptolyngbyaceae cyanobacterium MAG.088]|nr:phytanoyl-CoA dioxygenase family protein [Leptolyngbyaceae cyanobacterium MAG.088]
MLPTSQALTPKQIEDFHKNGFIGPFTMCTPEEMGEYRRNIEEEIFSETPVPEFSMKTGRDRHLDSPAVYDLITHPVPKSYLTQLLGAELQIWRSSFFVKPPGSPATVWHQTNVFKEFVDEPILEPPDPESLFQLTTWIAIDESTVENGCVQLLPGSHNTFKVKGIVDQVTKESRAKEATSYGLKDQGFFGYDIKFDTKVDPDKVVNMQCKPGQFFIFTQRLLHGSPPNNSQKRRLGVAFRTIQSNVKAYAHFLPAGKIEHYGFTFDLTKWGCALLGGDNALKLNPIAERPVVKRPLSNL